MIFHSILYLFFPLGVMPLSHLNDYIHTDGHRRRNKRKGRQTAMMKDNRMENGIIKCFQWHEPGVMYQVYICLWKLLYCSLIIQHCLGYDKRHPRGEKCIQGKITITVNVVKPFHWRMITCILISPKAITYSTIHTVRKSKDSIYGTWQYK